MKNQKIIELKGELRPASSMDSNTFVLTTVSGIFVGELIITEANMFKKIDGALREYGVSIGEMKSNAEGVKSTVKLPITLEIKRR